MLYEKSEGDSTRTGGNPGEGVRDIDNGALRMLDCALPKMRVGERETRRAICMPCTFRNKTILTMMNRSTEMVNILISLVRI